LTSKLKLSKVIAIDKVLRTKLLYGDMYGLIQADWDILRAKFKRITLSTLFGIRTFSLCLCVN